MSEEKCCCNCLHCARWQTSKGIECHCDLTDRYLGYLEVMDTDNNCCKWEKETKWDEEKKHDAKIRAEAIDEFVAKIKKHQYLLNSKINSKDYGMFTCGIEQIANELKAGGKE